MIMTETKNNFLAGEWLAGDTSVENRNPSDLSDVIGHFAQASSSQLTKALDAARMLKGKHAADFAAAAAAGPSSGPARGPPR